MSSVERKFFGVASGTVGTMRLVGQMLSLGISMLVFATVMGRVEIMRENYAALVDSLRILFAIFAVLSIGGIVASLKRGKLR
jgi:hypothetical protein